MLADWCAVSWNEFRPFDVTHQICASHIIDAGTVETVISDFSR